LTKPEYVDIPEVRQPPVTPALVWRTVRHLRPDQIRGQLWHRLRRRLEWPAALIPPEKGEYPGCRLTGLPEIPAPGGRRQDPNELQAGRFRFLNETRDLGSPPDWQARGASSLWRYNLHYFEWLWDLPFEGARRLCLDWIERHPLARGSVGWDPYPLSLRLQCWLPLLLGRHQAAVETDAVFANALWRSSARQVRWLLRRLERHIAGNHLLENAIALAVAGASFAGEEARSWQHAGRILIGPQLEEQFLADGHHYERSPMYQVRLLYALLVLAACDPEDWREWLAPTIGRGLTALRQVLHPDGEIALLNDSAHGVQCSPRELFALAERIGVIEEAPAAASAIALPQAGYHGLRTAQGDALIVDAAPIGPAHQPGHGHADLLSFELSVAGRRIVVDSGVGSYQDRRLRAYARSTAAHNTVEIDGRSQVELWGSFRVGRRTRPRGVDTKVGDQGFRLTAEHDGYAGLPGHPVHRRRVTLEPAGSGDGERAVLGVRDEITVGKQGRGLPAAVRVIFAPDLRLEAVEADAENLQKGPGTWRVVPDSDDDEPEPLVFAVWEVEGPRPGEVGVETVPVFPEFGVVRPASALVLRGELPLQATLRLSWTARADESGRPAKARGATRGGAESARP
jgi:uncharacterized heparinase superfamily protein